MARVTRPETHTLTLQSGETLIVKKWLNAGERRAMQAAMRGPDGRLNMLQIGQATMLAYLLDWTVKDDQTGDPLPIRELVQQKKTAELCALLDSLDPLDLKEMEDAIDKWDDEMIAKRKEEKKIPNGKPESGSSSSSVSDSTSDTTKSTTSTATSTT